MDEVKKKLSNPALVVAVIGLFGTMFSGIMAFLAVITAPAIRAYLGM